MSLGFLTIGVIDLIVVVPGAGVKTKKGITYLGRGCKSCYPLLSSDIVKKKFTFDSVYNAGSSNSEQWQEPWHIPGNEIEKLYI